MEIGKKIKNLRIQNGLTLEELASRTELSKGFLSQLENDLTSPSITTLSDLVEVLGVELSDFFKKEKQDQIVFTEDDFFVDEKHDVKVTWIVPNAQKNEMEPMLMELPPHTKSDDILPHDGEEFGYVLSGSIHLHFGDQSYRVSKGQTFYIDGSKTHSIENDTRLDAKVLWISTPPIF